MAAQAGGGLQLDESLLQEQREWRIQHVGWVLMGLVILAALVGLFGRGPVGQAVTGGPASPARMELNRLERKESKSRITIRLTPAAVRDGVATFWLDRQFLEGIDVMAMTPEPERVELMADRILYRFPTAGLSGVTSVVVDYRANKMGLRHGRIGVDLDEGDAFWQLVLP
ncbi:MAG: hypothetical protein AB2A00_07440 [Myxococcota bacterium]